LFLGNGGVGKRQLFRRLRDLLFDSTIPSTHGIQLGEMTVTLENLLVRLNLYYEDEWEYIAPELLPKWSDVQELLLGRLR
jgi:hypothetical protein